MKKILLCLTLVLLIAGCTEQGRWDRQQRREARQMLQQYRDMVYLTDMTDAEFILFTDDVAAVLEEDYPSYVTFVAMPAMADTVETVVVETIVEDIEANYRNMRHIFPYQMLIDQNVLPAGMTRQQLLDYYSCVAENINGYFGSLNDFIVAAANSLVDDNVTAQFLSNCASPYWTVESITVVETTN